MTPDLCQVHTPLREGEYTAIDKTWFQVAYFTMQSKKGMSTVAMTR